MWCVGTRCGAEGSVSVLVWEEALGTGRKYRCRCGVNGEEGRYEGTGTREWVRQVLGSRCGMGGQVQGSGYKVRRQVLERGCGVGG